MNLIKKFFLDETYHCCPTPSIVKYDDQRMNIIKKFARPEKSTHDERTTPSIARECTMENTSAVGRNHRRLGAARKPSHG